jgi:hypothetical protein
MSAPPALEKHIHLLDGKPVACLAQRSDGVLSKGDASRATRLGVNAPLSNPPLGGVAFIGPSVEGLFHFKRQGNVALWHEPDLSV